MKKTIYFYSFILSILPVLDLYSSTIKLITLGELVLIIFSLFTLLKIIISKKINVGKSGINNTPILLFSGLFILTLFSILFIVNNPSILNIFYRFIRLFLWTFTLSLTSYFFFNFSIFQKWVIRIGIVSTLYVFIQFIAWGFFAIYLPSVLNNNIFQPVSEGYADIESLTNFYNTRFIRPASFFGEPSYYAYYAIFTIILILFKNNQIRMKREYLLSLLLSTGVLISGSTAGLFLLVFIWIIHFLKVGYYYLQKRKVGSIKLFGYLCFIIFILFVLILSNTISVDNISLTFNKIFNYKESARIGGSYELLDNLKGIEKLFGVGFGNEDIYLGIEGIYYNSITIIILSSGYLGLMLFALYSFKVIFGNKNNYRIVGIIYVVLCFTSSILYSSFSILYLSVVFYIRKK